MPSLMVEKVQVIATRTRIDGDTYKTIYDLKKRVRSLERQLKERTAKEVTA